MGALMTELGIASYTLSSVLFLSLAVLLLFSWRGELDRLLMLIALIMSALWSGVAAYQVGHIVPGSVSLKTLEIFRDLAWLAFLFQLVNSVYRTENKAFIKVRRLLMAGATGLYLMSLIIFFVSMTGDAPLPLLLQFYVPNIGHALLGLAGLALVEQILQHAHPERRNAVKFICLGVGSLVAYDFILYVNSLALGAIDTDLWNVRGVVNSLSVVLISVPMIRKQDWSKEIFVSHSVVTHAAVFIAACLYLLIAVTGGYYIRRYDDDWGGVAQALFLFGAALVLLLLISSRRLRAHARIIIAKHFFNYKYDYREEWQRFIRTLSKGGAGPHLLERAVQAIAQIVESPGGKLWLRTEAGVYEPVSHWEMPNIPGGIVTKDSSLAHFLERWQWVVDFTEYESDPALYQDLKIPQWILDIPQGWLVVPLMQDIQLLGFILLKRSPVKMDFNWEDRDLLKTAGRQAATHIAQLMATQALIEAREFQAFSKLSAFIMHDIKNLIAQLTLVVANAAKHKNNPRFMEDAISTVENSVAKMNHLLKQLRTNNYGSHAKSRIDLAQLLFDVINARLGAKPVPILECRRRGLGVLADQDRLSSVFEHIIGNAQDATEAGGEIRVILYEEEGWAVIEIRDTGCGMTPEFVQHRLFRPFDSTKGDAGMGIGAYQCREYVHSLGGQVEVRSEPGRGTTFIIRLPAAASAGTRGKIEDHDRLKHAANMKW